MNPDPAVPAQRPGATSRTLNVSLIVLCQSMQALVLGGISLFLPLIRSDVHLSFSEAGSLGAASTLTYAFMQIPSGYIADRVGPRQLFALGLLGTNLLAFSFAQIHDYGLMLTNQIASGFFRALVFAPGLLLIVSLFPPRLRATAMGLYVAGGFSSNILLSSLGPTLVKPLGWRHMFEAFSIGGIVILAAFWRFSSSRKPAPSPASPGLSFRAVLGLFRHRVAWLLGAIQYVRLAVAFGLSFWLPTFIVEDRGYSLELAGLVMAIAAGLTAVSNFLGGYVSDRLQNPALVIRVSLAALAVTTALLVHVHQLGYLIALIACNALFVQLYFGPLFGFGIDVLGTQNAGIASGFGNFFANLGGFTFAYVLGAVKDATGSFEFGFYALAALCVFGLVCTIPLTRMAPLYPSRIATAE